MNRFPPPALGSRARGPARWGSFPTAGPVGETPALSRLKSITRILRLCPPPRCQLVMSPELRRPPVRCLIFVSALCGRSVVISSLTNVVLNRNDGVSGLYVLIGILCSSLPGTSPMFLTRYPRIRASSRPPSIERMLSSNPDDARQSGRGAAPYRENLPFVPCPPLP